MEYTISRREKSFQRNIPFQLWRLMALSFKFVKLTRLGDVQSQPATNSMTGKLSEAKK